MASDDNAPALRVPRRLPLSDKNVVAALLTILRYSRRTFVGLKPLVASFDAPRETTVDTFHRLTSEGLLVVSPPLGSSASGRSVEKLQAAGDAWSDVPEAARKSLHHEEYRHIASCIDYAESDWRHETVDQYIVRPPARDPGRAAEKPDPSMLPWVDASMLESLVEAEMGANHRLRGVTAAWMAQRLGVEERELAPLFDEAVREGWLTRERVNRREVHRVPGPGEVRGPLRLLRVLSWTSHKTLRRRRNVEIAEATGLDESTVTRTLRDLMNAGLVRREDGAEGSWYHARDALPSVLEELVNMRVHGRATTMGELLDAFAARHETHLSRETCRDILDELVPEWLEDPTPDSRYREGRRPYNPFPLRNPVVLTADAWAVLRRCATCAEPWGERMLRTRCLYKGSRSTAIVHDDCPDARASELFHIRPFESCARCRERVAPDHVPVRLADIPAAAQGCLIDLWLQTDARIVRMLEGARSVAPEGGPWVARLDALERERERAQAADLLTDEGCATLRRWVETHAPLVHRELPSTMILYGRLEREGEWTHDHEEVHLRRLAEGIAYARPRTWRFRALEEGFAHPACEGARKGA